MLHRRETFIYNFLCSLNFIEASDLFSCKILITFHPSSFHAFGRAVKHSKY
uniref:Uncharacterized protein n=1 Tax=Anguilla anguilla TaxID=7936 RepID=A0A0E9RG30_ANGAN